MATQVKKMKLATETQGWMCPAPGAPLVFNVVKLPPLKSTQVQIEMKMCGLCHTDVHMCDNDWGITNYPVVPGHEGIGIVSAVGNDVQQLKIGDRVGVGWIRDSCGECEYCSIGRENICLNVFQGTYLYSNAGSWGKGEYNTQGCFSKLMQVEEKFAFKIPEKIPSKNACALLCAGATVWEPICNHVKPGYNVGIVSIGGLGTFAVKLAHIMGAHVVAISSSADKEAAVKNIGANEFIVSSNKDAMTAAARTLDVIIDTCPVNNNLSSVMDLLKLNGTYVRVGLPRDANFTYSWIPLIFTQRAIAGSVVTGSVRTNSLLATAAAKWDFLQDTDDWSVEVVPFDMVNEAMNNLRDRKNKGYRYVLEW